MSTASRVIKNTGFLYIRIAITMIVAFWTTRIILNALGEDDFGVYSAVGGLAGMLAFLNASLSGATQRFINLSEAKGDEEGKKIIFNNSLILHAFLATVLIVLLIIIGIFAFLFILNIPPQSYLTAKYVYGFLIVSTAISVLNVPYEAEINAHEEMGIYAVVGITDAALKLIIAFSVKYADANKLLLYSILMTVVPMVTLCVLATYCHHHYPECKIHPSKYFRKGSIKSLAGFAGWNFVNTTSSVVTQSGFNLVINHFFGVLLNTAQGITHQVGSALMNLSSNVEKAINPIIVKREGANQRRSMIYVSLMGCRMTFFIFSFFALFVVSEMTPILTLWLKDVPKWTVIFCQLQLIRVALELLTRGVHLAIMAQGNIKMYSIVRSVVNILPLILTIWAFYAGLAPYWMYVIWIICWSILGGIISLIFAKRNIGLTYHTYINEVLLPSIKSILPAILIIVACKILCESNAVDLVSTVIADFVFLILSYRYLFTTPERNELHRLLQRLRKH